MLAWLPTAAELRVQVSPQQSLALVEYIAHLSVQDWTAVTGDLQRLGGDSSQHPAQMTHSSAFRQIHCLGTRSSVPHHDWIHTLALVSNKCLG